MTKPKPKSKKPSRNGADDGMVEVTWLPEPHADDPSHPLHKSRLREQCVTFHVPRAFAYGAQYRARLRLPSGVEVSHERTWWCPTCCEKLRHDYSMSTGQAGLSCSCSAWIGTCSPFSGSWHGGELTRRPLSRDELEQRRAERIAEVEAQYDALLALRP